MILSWDDITGLYNMTDVPWNHFKIYIQSVDLYYSTAKGRKRCHRRAYEHGLALIAAWKSNYIHYTVWAKITYPFLNFNNATDWISNFIPHFSGACDTYLCWD